MVYVEKKQVQQKVGALMLEDRCSKMLVITPKKLMFVLLTL